MKRSVLLVDDDEAVRELLGRYIEDFLEYQVVGQTGSGLAAIELFRKTFPHLAIVDLLLPELCGHELVSRIRKELPETRIVIFTGVFEPSVLANALRCEPDGFVHKSESVEVLAAALRTASAGGRFLSPKLNHYINLFESGPAQSLSAREIEVMQSIAEGKCNKEIGRLLGVATKTVGNHRARLMHKLGVHNAASLTLAAVQMGIVSAPSIKAGLLKNYPFPHPQRLG
jgi:DNA-binding NarL/FixJ family response regulator